MLACERYNQYIHGRDCITVDTDHKPLAPIFTTATYNATKRLQRMLMRLQKYHLKVQYCPGSKMFIADMLSRAYLVDSTPKPEENFQLFQLQQEKQLYKDIEQLLSLYAADYINPN